MSRESKVKLTSLYEWRKHPIYRCVREDWSDISEWMLANDVEHTKLFYDDVIIFEVASKHEWFAMRWS